MFQLHYTPISNDEILSYMHPDFVGRGKKLANVPAAFDIETTSFYVGDEKRATMYVWQFGYNGYVTMGRTWGEFKRFLHAVSSHLDLDSNKRLIVYVHNLGFEFQFMRKLFTWEKVFSNDLRNPIYAITNEGVEFRDSLILSGYSLSKLGDELTKYHVEKLVGDLDYSLSRNCETPLTEKEIGYCVNDVLVVMAYIQELIERYGNIANLPLTKTGFVRKAAKAKCLRNGRQPNRKYKRLMSELTINNLEEFAAMHRAFQGGFTHANPAYSGRVLENVASFDFTSSYPTVMLTEQFPMSRGKLVKVKSQDHFNNLMANYCCIFDVEIFNLQPIFLCDSPLSASKCAGLEDAQLNNGRVFSAAHLYTTITNVDFEIYKKFYKWDYIKVSNVWVYRKDYLPKELISFIIELYQSKTKLKGVEGKEVEYMQSKAMLNSVYGMCVTNPMKEDVVYENDSWGYENETTETLQAKLDKYNNDEKRFLFYPWGVFVTAYARRNLFTGIKEFATDYVYSDTDSIKVRNADLHNAYIEKYNAEIERKCRAMCEHYGLPADSLAPLTVKGVKKQIGVWEYEGTYSKFKTLGAKRYMVVSDGKLSLTVSGVNKKIAVPWLLETFGSIDSVFAHFTNTLAIPPTKTGKLLHTYIDEPMRGSLVDYTGHSAEYMELSALHLEPTGYTLSIGMNYLNFIRGIREGRQ
jgi:hypothetical protein